MYRTALLISGVFVGGAVIGLLFGRTLRTPPSQLDETVERSRSGETEARIATAGEGQSTLLRAVEGRADIRKALGLLRVSKHEKGEASISGQVRSEGGEPIAGVLVQATVSRFETRQSRFVDLREDNDVEQAVLDFLDNYQLRRQTTREAHTDSEGLYEITGLRMKRRYTIRGYKKNWTFDTAPGHHRYEELPGGTIDLVGTPSLHVHMTVEFMDGRQPDSATLYWESGTEEGAESWYPRAPDIQLPAGDHTLYVKAGDSREFASETQTITLAQEVNPPDLYFVLRPRSGIRGRLVFPAGQAPRRASVFLVKSRLGSPADETRLLDGERKTVRADEGYEFDFKDVEPGTYLLGAGRSRDHVAVSRSVQITAQLRTIEDLHVPLLRPDEFVEVSVFAPDGEILQDVDVSLDGASVLGSPIEQPDGSLLVAFEVDDDAKSSPLTLEVDSEVYGEAGVEFTPGVHSEVNVGFHEPGSLNVTIADYPGCGYEDLLRISFWKDSRRKTSHRRLDSEGRQRFGPVQAGDYEVQLALKAPHRGGYQWLTSVLASVGAGENESTVSIPPLYSLVVTGATANPGDGLVLSFGDDDAHHNDGRDDVWQEHQTFRADGKAVFNDLIPGTYSVKGPQNERLVVHVPAQVEAFLGTGGVGR